jgi:hypothetical protein
VAFYCWAKGYFEKTSADQLRDIPASTKMSDMEAIPFVWNEETESMGIRVQRRDLPDYSTPDFWEAVGMWKDWKMFGFPNGGGSMDQPTLWFDIIRLMQSCAEKMKVE